MKYKTVLQLKGCVHSHLYWWPIKCTKHPEKKGILHCCQPARSFSLASLPFHFLLTCSYSSFPTFDYFSSSKSTYQSTLLSQSQLFPKFVRSRFEYFSFFFLMKNAYHVLCNHKILNSSLIHFGFQSKAAAEMFLYEKELAYKNKPEIMFQAQCSCVQVEIRMTHALCSCL